MRASAPLPVAGWLLVLAVLLVVCPVAFAAGLVQQAAVRLARLLPWHWRADCPGRWRTRGRWLLCCDGCAAHHAFTSRAAARAAADNARGGLLRFLASEADPDAPLPAYRETRAPSPARLSVEVAP